jgi:hypothetical protein
VFEQSHGRTQKTVWLRFCAAGSIAGAHNLNKDKNNRPLDCNVHNIDSSSIKLHPKVERVRAVFEKNRKHHHTIQTAAVTPECNYLNVRFLQHAGCDCERGSAGAV